MASNRHRMMLKTVAATLCVAAVASAAVGWVVLESGWYHVGATEQHWQPVHTLLEKGMHESVRFHARSVPAPPPASAARTARGAAVYRSYCVQCHGAPGVAQADFGKAMQPVPGPLVDAAARWQERELYWITRHGIKMSGMPAWEYHLPEADIWAVVAFVEALPGLSASAYAALPVQPVQPERAPPEAPVPARGDAQRGRIALSQYACNACHMIPGVTGSQVYVGRPLKHLARRTFVAGKLPMTQENLMRWIMHPHAVDPLTAMPEQGVTQRDAQDMSAYLLTLR
jgi:mono/diheme cytochrome c family protein